MRVSEFAWGALALLLLACGPTRVLDVPPAFKKYEDADDLRLITADGVRVAAREVDNEPKADLAFWTDAMKRHLEKRGYTFRAEDCFNTRKGLRGCTLDFMLPYGNEDWVMSETIFVIDDRIVLVEAAGPFERYQPVEQQLRAALRTFEPGG
ncbi:MAG: hypothetical protein KC620_08810 [Myxococcales bacterium]|nr:hypothetical protein [Myxococcales bacterium]